MKMSGNWAAPTPASKPSESLQRALHVEASVFIASVRGESAFSALMSIVSLPRRSEENRRLTSLPQH